MSHLRPRRRRLGPLTSLGAVALIALAACSGAGPDLVTHPPTEVLPAGTNRSPSAGDGAAPRDAATIVSQLHDATDVTITPITGIGALDAGDGTVIGLDIQPHGLQLARLARLEILGADPGEVVGFGYSGTGVGAELTVLDPDPEQLAVYVEHFSGAGVGPFAALSEAIAATTPPARAEFATAAAAAHNRQAGSDPDRVAQAFSDLVGAIEQLADTAKAECGTSGPSTGFSRPNSGTDAGLVECSAHHAVVGPGKTRA